LVAVRRQAGPAKWQTVWFVNAHHRYARVLRKCAYLGRLDGARKWMQANVQVVYMSVVRNFLVNLQGGQTTVIVQ